MPRLQTRSACAPIVVCAEAIERPVLLSDYAGRQKCIQTLTFAAIVAVADAIEGVALFSNYARTPILLQSSALSMEQWSHI